MVFSSEIFIFFFLVVTLTVYYLVPKKMQNGTLLFFSFFVFYAWDKPYYALIMAGVTALNFLCALIIEKAKTNTIKKLFLTLGIIISLLNLAFFKYTDLFLVTLNDIIGTRFGLLKLALPIGISFYTFQALSYTVDIYRGKCKAQKNFINFAAYITMFPQLIAGPIVRYTDIESDLQRKRSFSPTEFSIGAKRFIIGLAKKVILANTLAESIKNIESYGDMTAALAWLSAIMFTFQIYYDFSGYSDMAIGMGKMLGFTFLENFNYPYTAKSITDFWRRWHISLSSWFLEYLYIPLGGNRVSKLRLIINLLIVWGLTGLWHGAEWNFLFWGLYFGVILIIEKLFLLKILEKLPTVIRRIYALFIIIIGWVIFSKEGINQVFLSLSQMFSGVLFSKETLYFLLSNLAVLIISSLFSFNIKALIPIGVKDAKVVRIGYQVALIILFIISVAYLVGGTYNPFLYFRF